MQLQNLAAPASAADSAQRGPSALTTSSSLLHTLASSVSAELQQLRVLQTFADFNTCLFGRDGCFNGCLDNDGVSNHIRSTTVGGLCPGIPWCPEPCLHNTLHSTVCWHCRLLMLLEARRQVLRELTRSSITCPGTRELTTCRRCLCPLGI